MTGTLHKLTAGSGYDYLTRNVAVQDSTEKGHTTLASYYTERGETPGCWVGSGVADLGDLAVGDAVSAEQMQSLFGAGFHPNAAARLASLPEEATAAQIREASRLGTPFKVYSSDVSDFRQQLAIRFSAWNKLQGRDPGAPIPVDVRAQIRSDLGRETFTAAHGRPPADEVELQAEIARQERPRTTACAGYDLTFSPAKSVSTLWAVAPVDVAAAIERAHNAAVADALTYLERDALYTRRGANGVRQVDVTGLVGAAFTHRDSRSGDPDLHTHVAIANKVRTPDGAWLAIDGRVLYKAMVSISEIYNTQLETHLSGLGIQFETRPHPDVRKRPTREIRGVSPDLNDRWSSRRAAINARREDLAVQFHRDHGRPPTPVEMIGLAQQANLQTRQAKHSPRTLAEQRTEWAAQASHVLGGAEQITTMVRSVLRPAPRRARPSDLQAVAGEIVARVSQDRAVWQAWHLHAEAQRRARRLSTPNPAAVAEELTRLAISQCVSLAAPADPVAEPASLRRADGASVYDVAGAQLYTSTAIQHAERTLLGLAGSAQGTAVDDTCVDLALLESSANGVDLNPGQVQLVRQMATSGRLLQLAIAAAGTGKTTAMSTLTRAWTNGGGTVIGLAPSAAAAAVLEDQTSSTADTLAKLVYDITHGDTTMWDDRVDAHTLVIIDEAGMADTLSLAAAAAWLTDRGAAVRLVGDTQQLAAIGAGGILRDIETQHGATYLSQVMRFHNPTEAAASLALRDGQPVALGWYLDQGRIHAGDLTSSIDHAFTAWMTDRSNGLDALLLAPTREITTDLNQRARAHRLHTLPTDTGTETTLTDGNNVSAGDLIVTRLNNRQLRTSSTDFVKNGDRWRVHEVHPDGSLRAQHIESRRYVTLPARYVATHVDLGYAVTTHTAQGVTADTCHGILNGTETRQQMYTMITRGRHTNHIYAPVVGDGDDHSLLRPETIHPSTTLETLERILATDGSPVSVASQHHRLHDPTSRIADATDRYTDALYVAAEQTLPASTIDRIDHADQIIPGLQDAPAWAALRPHLILLAASGHDPHQALTRAAATADLSTATDPAAVLSWRLDPTGHRDSPPGPLPWLPGIPDQLAQHATWGPYLTARADLITTLSAQVRANPPTTPAWLTAGIMAPSDDVIADIEVWRAAHRVDPTDRRPTGPTHRQKAALRWQQHLHTRIHSTPTGPWAALLPLVDTTITTDPFYPELLDRLDLLQAANRSVEGYLAEAAAQGPLPAERPAAALWWRIHSHLSDDLAAAITDARPAQHDLIHHLQHLDPQATVALQGSPLWPALLNTVDQCTARGIPLTVSVPTATTDIETMILRAAVMTTDHDPDFEPPPDPDDDQTDQPTPVDAADIHDEHTLAGRLALEARLRDALSPDISTLLTRAGFDAMDRWDASPVPEARLLQINNLTAAFYTTQLPHTWAHHTLHDRLHTDITDDPRFRVGYAPNGWTTLVDHLHQHGITDQEMLTAGVASRTKNGRLIDRFRDRLMFPIITNHHVLGFTGRRNPTRTDDPLAGPKYLNTPATPLYAKSELLYGHDFLNGHATPVIGEGPLDAIAITLASNGTHVGVAPLGSAFTDQQALLLATQPNPIIATDNDPAGVTAAERAFWRLAAFGHDPTRLTLPTGTDPADLLTHNGPDALRHALTTTHPIGEQLLEEALTAGPLDRAAQVMAARPPEHWKPHHLERRLRLTRATAYRALLHHVVAWNTDPLRTADQSFKDGSRLPAMPRRTLPTSTPGSNDAIHAV